MKNKCTQCSHLCGSELVLAVERVLLNPVKYGHGKYASKNLHFCSIACLKEFVVMCL